MKLQLSNKTVQYYICEKNFFILQLFEEIYKMFNILHFELVKMAPRMAAVLRAPGKLCSFSYVLFVFLLFYVLDVVSITVYDRDTLLNIGSSVAQRKPDFEFLNELDCSQTRHQSLLSGSRN